MLLDDWIYFITTKTFDMKNFFKYDADKLRVFQVLKQSCSKFNIGVYAWVVLDNHYHLLVRVVDGPSLPRFIQNFHGNASRLQNKADKVIGRRIWYQYQDHCIRNDRDFWIHFNYIHHNPIKHNYVNDMAAYPFSSYRYWLRCKGEKWVYSCFYEYQIRDYTRRSNVL